MRDAADITFVLDKSGSMDYIKSDTIGGFNSFLDEQKKVPKPAVFTLVQFDSNYSFVTEAVNIQDVKPLNDELYKPGGYTALLDAIGTAISRTGSRLAAMAEADRPDKVIFVVLTDGYENASAEYTKERIKDMIDEQSSKYNWQFMFLGANQDAIMTAAGLGINAGNAMTYAHTGQGINVSYAATARCMTAFRNSGNANALNFSENDRAAAITG